MSLDVYLFLENKPEQSPESKIYIREDGQTKEISLEEWNRRFPHREPVMCLSVSNYVYHGNITSNLAKMAMEAALYGVLWEPYDAGIRLAHQLIEPLQTGLALLKSDPERFRQYNPPNKWGSYEVLVRFVAEYLQACKKYPDAKVDVCR